MKVYHKSSPTLLKGDGSRTTYDTPSFYLITETFFSDNRNFFSDNRNHLFDNSTKLLDESDRLSLHIGRFLPFTT